MTVRSGRLVWGCMRPVPGEPGRHASPVPTGWMRSWCGRLARPSRASQPRPTGSGGVGQLVLGPRRAGRVEGVFDLASDRVDRLGVFADRVQRAVFAPAGDVGDRLTANVEADGAADD